ncbi:MAG: hypothetical protein AAF184_25620, partial [Pseudomonadota bacterium]
ERASIMASYHDGGTGVVPSADGVIVVGRIGADVASEGGAVAVKVNSALGTEWHAQWDHPAHSDLLHSIAPTDGGFVVTGRTRSLNPELRGSMLLMKLPYEGRVTLEDEHGFVGRYMATASTGESGGLSPGYAAETVLASPAELVVLGPIEGINQASAGLCLTRLTETGAQDAFDGGGCVDAW